MKLLNKYIYILGHDGVGWSIDKDRLYLEKAIKDLDYQITSNIFKADIIYSVWWNLLIRKRFLIFRFFFRKAELIVSITNDLSQFEESGIVQKLIKISDKYVYANLKQKKFLLSKNIKEKNLYYNPFYVDEKVFSKQSVSRSDIARRFCIEKDKIKNKFLIGSFQRDSLGENLLSPKWQKNPDLLVNILLKLKDIDYCLIIAGPRRHYIISQLERYSINYIFVGDKSYIDNTKDDIKENNLSDDDINLLNALVDLCIVSSSSEGGPKAIPEAVLTMTSILSTDVGFAHDLLVDESIYHTKNECVEKILKIQSDSVYRNKIIEQNYTKVRALYSYELYRKRVMNTIEGCV